MPSSPMRPRPWTLPGGFVNFSKSQIIAVVTSNIPAGANVNSTSSPSKQAKNSFSQGQPMSNPRRYAPVYDNKLHQQ